MRKTLIALSAVAILGFVQSQAVQNETYPVNYTVPVNPGPAPVPVPVRKANNITVKFDEEAAKNVSNSIFRVFRRLGWGVVDVIDHGGVGNIQGGIRDIYKNTWGKIIIDYGKIIGPLYRAYGDLIQDVSVNATCNQTCAVRQCFRPEAVKYGLNDSSYDYYYRKTYDLGFERDCFARCGCKFNIVTKMNTTAGKKEIEGKVKKLQESLNNYNKKVVQLENDAEKIIDDRFRQFGEQVDQLQNDFYYKLRTTAINELGCDSACVNTCTNPNYFEFYEVPSCIAECKCSKIEGALDISNGKYSLSSLAMYADGDVEAWMSFKNSL